MPRRKKSSKAQDYITNLPDFIIAHILSFLTTTDAVRTGILSKRWKYMWTFLTKHLYFCDGEKTHPYRIQQFPNFVSTVLFHIKSANIQKFTLSMGEKYKDDYINQWLFAVFKRRVKDIYIKALSYYNFPFYPLFQYPFLQTLSLHTMLGCIIKLPTFVCFPSLTSLSFNGIAFTCYSSDKLNELTLKLPLLRNYTTTDCTWLGVKSVTFEAPLLEKLCMGYLFSRRNSPTESPTEIKFCASHLTRFVYYGYISSLSHTILVDGHIASAFISFTRDTSVEEARVSLPRFLSLFTNTECLELNLSDLQCLAQVEDHLAGNPAFGMLGHLQLNCVTGEVLLSFLLKSPCLKTLVFQMDKFHEETQNFAIVPDCFLSTLKVVEIKCFSGGESELSFAKFVMENAQVLERINFSFVLKLPSSEVEKAKEKLFLFEKSCSTLIVEFSTGRY